MLFKDFWNQHKQPQDLPLEEWSDLGDTSLDDLQSVENLYENLRQSQDWDIIALLLKNTQIIGMLKDVACHDIHCALVANDPMSLKMVLEATAIDHLSAHCTEIIRLSYHMLGLAGVELLLNIKPESGWIACDSNESFCYAASAGKLDLFLCLYSHPSVKNQAAVCDNDAFRRAAYNGQLEIVNKLLEDPSVVELCATNDNEALFSAVEGEQSEIVDKLLTLAPIRSILTNFSLQPELIRKGLIKGLYGELRKTKEPRAIESEIELQESLLEILGDNYALPSFDEKEIKLLVKHTSEFAISQSDLRHSNRQQQSTLLFSQTSTKPAQTQVSATSLPSSKPSVP